MSRVFSSANTGANANAITTPQNAVYNTLQAFTISSWVYPTASPDGDSSTIYVKDAANAYSPVMQFNANGTTTLTGTVGTLNATPAMFTSNDLLTLSAWSNVILTFNFSGDKKMHVYVNGTEINYSVQQALVGSIPSDAASGWTFGNDTFGDGWDGRIAEMAIWNTVLTGPQIAAVAAATNGVASIQSANLVGYWHLCGTMSPEPDVINGNDGVLSTNPPTQGANSPGFNCGAGPTPPPGTGTNNTRIIQPGQSFATRIVSPRTSIMGTNLGTKIIG